MVAVSVLADAADLPDRLHACAQQQDRELRLACFDAEVARLPDAGAGAQSSVSAQTNSRVPAPTDRVEGNASAAAPAVKAGDPGETNAPKDDQQFGVRGGALAQKQVSRAPSGISSRVSAVKLQPRGELVLTLDNGQVWQQTEAIPGFPVTQGDVVAIKTGALGSYRLVAPSGRVTRVTRVN